MSFAVGIELAAFALGLLFGSFLNVCIARLPDHQSIVRPGSACTSCGHAIRWYDNIPLLSWLLLRGKCRYCHATISWRYPAVELAYGLWVLVLVQKIEFLVHSYAAITRDIQANTLRGIPPYIFPWNTVTPRLTIDSLGLAVLGFLLIGLLVMDWRTHKLPDAFTLTGTLIAFVLICCRAVFLLPHEDELLLHGRNPLTSPGNVTDRGNVILTGPEHLVLGRLLAICAAAGLVLLIRLAYQLVRGREGLGLGDAKLMAMIAGFLGFWPAILALFLGSVLCSVYALGLLVRGRASATTRLPLGSFLCAGGLIAAVFGPGLIAWYTSLL